MNILDWLKSIKLNEWLILSQLLICLFIIIKGTSWGNSQMGNLWFLVLKLKDLDELQPLWKFQWISMFNVWDNWDQSFYDIPKLYDILVLFPYKEITKTLNFIFSKTTQRNFNILSRDDFSSQYLSFYAKKVGVKRWTQNF